MKEYRGGRSKTTIAIRPSVKPRGNETRSQLGTQPPTATAAICLLARSSAPLPLFPFRSPPLPSPPYPPPPATAAPTPPSLSAVPLDWLRHQTDRTKLSQARPSKAGGERERGPGGASRQPRAAGPSGAQIPPNSEVHIFSVCPHEQKR